MILKSSSKDNLQRSYSIADMIELCWCILRSKILNRQIRLIRWPFVLRGRKFIDFGIGLTTGYWCRFEVFPKDNNPRMRLKFGDNIQVNDFVHISAMDSVEIGDGCMFASHVYISDNSHGVYEGENYAHSSPDVAPDHRQYITAPVKIGKNCWLGEGVIVMPGVTIGDGCVIGAHSVVNKDIPAASIAVGSPASVIKQFNYKTERWEKI